MKTLLISSVLAALTASHVFAQLAILPPPSAVDGTPVLAIGINSGPTHWEDPSTLGRYRLASDENMPLPSGLTWASTQPLGISAKLAAIDNQGGAIRAIFTGETARWLNDFGYAYPGNPSGPDSFTVFSNIQAVDPATISFGDHVDVLFAPSDNVAEFDFWLNGTDSFTTANPPPPTANGGVYTVFHQTNSVPYLAPGNVKFLQAPIMVNTFVAAAGAYQNIETYLVSIEDWRVDRGADRDSSDFVFALQFFQRAGTPSDDNPAVPEPSSYSVLAGLGLIVLAVLRRKRLSPSTQG